MRVHPRADLDVIDSFSYLAGRDPALARKFLDAVEAALAKVQSSPDSGHRYLRSGREDEGWRYLRIPGFKKYLVFYRLTDIEIEVVRVVHASRDLEAIFRVL
jgi:toxin ParE1/3/4